MGVSKSTEMTIRNPLQQELRKHGVTVVPEFSVSTPAEPSRREHYNLKQDNVTIIDRAKKIFADVYFRNGPYSAKHVHQKTANTSNRIKPAKDADDSNQERMGNRRRKNHKNTILRDAERFMVDFCA